MFVLFLIYEFDNIRSGLLGNGQRGTHQAEMPMQIAKRSVLRFLSNRFGPEATTRTRKSNILGAFFFAVLTNNLLMKKKSVKRKNNNFSSH